MYKDDMISRWSPLMSFNYWGSEHIEKIMLLKVSLFHLHEFFLGKPGYCAKFFTKNLFSLFIYYNTKMDNTVKEDLPKHMSVDMAIAPDQKPYEHTHVIHTQRGEEQQNKLAQHSLSPEKLGVVGYVKDVAGFVKDVVEDRRQKRATARRRRSVGSITDSSRESEEEQTTERRRSSAEHHQTIQQLQQQHQQQQQQQQEAPSSPTRLADAVTGLFPGVGNSNHDAPAGCTHADELRNQMMHINEQNDSSKLI